VWPPVGGVEGGAEAGGAEVGELHLLATEQDLDLQLAPTVAPALLARHGGVVAVHLPARLLPGFLRRTAG
jgi:hypothetical protein